MIRRMTATLLIGLGTLGVTLCGLGVFSIWRTADGVITAAEDALLLMTDTLDDVDDSLSVTSHTLEGIAVAMDGLYIITLDMGAALSTTKMTIDEMAVMTGSDLPRSIESSLVALEALEETAAVIDQFLYGLHRLGIGSYNPEISMDQAVAQAALGLEPVPNNLRTMSDGLELTGENLSSVRVGIGLMGDHMLGLQENVIDADAAVSSHRNTMQQVRSRVVRVRHNVHGPIRAVAWGVTILLVWIGLSQLALVRWGVRIWPRSLCASESPDIE